MGAPFPDGIASVHVNRTLRDESLAHPVEGNRNDGNRNALFERLAEAQGLQRLQKVVAEAGGADEGRDHDHRQGLHNDLVGSHHDRRAGRGNLHFEKELPIAATDHASGFQDVCGHVSDSENRTADHRWNGEDRGGDQGRHLTEAEEHDHRHQIGEMRRCLHHVQKGCDQALEPPIVCRGDTDRQPDGDAEGHRDDDERKGFHRALPNPEKREVQEAAAGDQGDPPSACVMSDNRRHGDDEEPRQGRNIQIGPTLMKERLGKRERNTEQPGKTARDVTKCEEAETELFAQPMENPGQPVIDGNDQGLGVFGDERHAILQRSEDNDQGHRDEDPGIL